LLNLETTGYSEGYRRFYFRDIQSITIRQTQHWLSGTAAVGVVGLACLGLAVAIPEIIARYIFGALGAAFGVALVLNLAAGPTCVCQVRTAVQVEVLPALNRVRRARRILEQVRPLIREAQGGLLTAGEVAVLAGQTQSVGGTERAAPAETGEPDRLERTDLTGYKSVPPEDANRTA
jgi:hypothetical protein